MTNEQFQEFYKKNKLAVIGVPFLIGFVLINQFVLKPRLLKKQPGTAAAVEAVGAQTASQAGAEAPAPIGPPPPLTVSMALVPPLNQNVETRFQANEQYPFEPLRNVFEPFYKEGTEGPTIVPIAVSSYTEEVVERPDITYHGFFTIGHDRIAILKLAGRAILTRTGQKVIETPFVLETIQPDRVEVVDSENQTRRFEVALYDGPAGGQAIEQLPPGVK